MKGFFFLVKRIQRAIEIPHFCNFSKSFIVRIQLFFAELLFSCCPLGHIEQGTRKNFFILEYVYMQAWIHGNLTTIVL